MATPASTRSESKEYQAAGPAFGGYGAASGAGTEPVIDLVHLARQTDSDPALERELLDMFDRQSGRIVQQLRDARAGGAGSGGDLAHTLKGSALSMGAARVARTAHLYEAACAAGLRGGALSATLEPLAEAVAEARATIASLLA